METLSYKGKQFYLGEQPFTIISGAIHYFRTMPEYWEDRLTKLKACGFNTVETYMCWNLHEEAEGQFNFEGMLDIVRFIKIAEKLGLKVIVRPGPYICAEWEFGGLPYWLLKYPGMRLRCNYQPFLEKAKRYYEKVAQLLVPLLATNGGPVIAVQIENEYGSYGNDKDYLRWTKNTLEELGFNVMLFTSDGPTYFMLGGGTLPDVYKIANFGSRAKESFELMEEIQPDAPYMCGEFWNGWFDHWGDEHHTRDAQSVAEELNTMLEMGGNVNFYMFHGGTNFNFYNGANFDKYIQPTVTCYDYDCLLTENGKLTKKYYAVKEVLEKHGFKNDDVEVNDIKTKIYNDIKFNQCAPLFDNLNKLSSPVHKAYTPTMEEMNQAFGFILYRTTLNYKQEKRKLSIDDVHDRAMIFANGKFLGIKDRMGRDDKIEIGVENGETVVLDILVENLGRINYGYEIYDSKGITKQVRFDNQTLHGWEIYSLPMKDLKGIEYKECENAIDMPCFYKSEFEINEVADTFINMENFSKGVVFVNGFNIGRYWEIGPTKGLYIPAPLLKEGNNVIEVFELHSAKNLSASFGDEILYY